MRVSRAPVAMLGLMLAASPLPAAGDPFAPIPDPALMPWAKVVRARVAIAVASIRRPLRRGRAFDRGRVGVGFIVTATGEIVAVRVDGAPGTAARATAALQALGRVPSPPDDRSHAINVNINFR